MDSWNNAPYSSDPSANRQPRYGSNVLQNSASAINQTRDFNPPQQQQQPQHQPQQSSGYQAYHGSSSLQTGSSSAVATPSTSRADSSADYMDIDPENYSRSKYSQNQSRDQGSRQPYLQSEDPSTISQRYSPLNSLSPQAQYTSGPSTVPQQMPSNYQARQSPSRPNYTNLTQSYYNQSTGSPRTSAPPAMQSYSHPLQQQQTIPQQPNISRQSSMSNATQLPPITIQNPADGNNTRYFPASATIQQASFDQSQSSPRGAQQLAPQMEPAPQFSRVTSANDLQPRVHAQPAFRRANPEEGGFISVCLNPILDG